MEENTSKNHSKEPEETPADEAGSKKEPVGGTTTESSDTGTAKPKGGALEGLPTATVRCWEGVLTRISGMMDVERFHWVSALAARIGNWAVLVSSVIALLLGLVLAIKMDSFRPFLGGIGFVVLLSVLHYSAVKFIDSGKKLIAASPSQVSTDAFPHSVALISLVCSLVVLIGGIVMAIQAESLQIFLQAVPGFFILLFLVWLAVNPALTETRVAAIDSAGEEAISVISFFMKAFLRMVPILFGVLTVWGGVVLLVAIFQSFGSEFAELKAMQTALYGGVVLLWGAGLPFAAFLGFILYYLIIDVIRSILVIPGKLGN